MMSQHRIIKDVRNPLSPTQPEQSPQVEQQLRDPDYVVEYVKPVPVPHQPADDITVELGKSNNANTNQTDELLSATSPPQVFGPSTSHQGYV